MPIGVKPSKTFRRKKNQEPEPEPEPKLELDLTTALPSSDDFRTSLLMSGLSARFSMLREQDDPNSKIGKASDDSVLFPKRQSRLNDLAFASYGLSDIAEVSSISSSVRPPLAYSRTDSFHGGEVGYGTDDESIKSGSIMNRGKPGEGNVLFGGRQKIYMGNRTLYDNDVSQSAFQKLREREKEQKEQERQTQEDNDAESSRPSSPPLSGYNKDRETSSTTSSAGPSITRSSTAATSVTSQRTPSLSGAHTPVTPNVPVNGNGGLERSLTKTRRLYETGLDNLLHEQQFSAMNRIDTLTRQRTLGAHTPPPALSPTFANLQSDRWDRQQVLSKQSMPNLRAASPPPTGAAMGTFDFGVRLNNVAESKSYGIASPPLSPAMTEFDEHGGLQVQPNDRGKATALGAFSKPTPYDEAKYSQRQVQLQQARETPPPRAFVPRSQAQPVVAKKLTESNATFLSETSRSNSIARRQFMPQDRTLESPPKPKVQVPDSQTIASGALLISSDGNSTVSSPDETSQEQKLRGHPKPLDLSGMYRADQRIKLERPPESQHPANRQRPFSPESSASNSQQDQNHPTTTTVQLKVEPPVPSMNQPADSPTLGPTTGLSGMVRQHLRSDSNCSSNYGGEQSASYNSPARFPTDASEPVPQNDYSSKDNPWDNEDWDQSYYGEISQDDVNPLMVRGSVVPPPLSVRSPNIDTTGQESRKTSWEKELEIHHTRDGSSETQKERQDFKEELASRRRRVQENLKSFVETESRSVSPLPGSEWPKDGLSNKSNPLGLLKPKTSRGSLIGRPKEQPQSKAMKMLGLGNTTISSSPSPGKSSFDDNPWKQEEEEMLRGVTAPTTPPQTRAFRQARRDAQRDRERQVAMRHQQRMGQEGGEPGWQGQRRENEPRPSQEQHNDKFPPNIRTHQRSPSRERKPPPVTYIQRNASQESSSTSRSTSRPASRISRDRSESDASGGRSKSRNGRYRDEQAETMPKGTPASTQAYYEDLEVPAQRPMARSPGVSPMLPQHSPMPSPMMAQTSRSRANSKSAPSGYFDPQKLQIQTSGGNVEILSPRPSPVAPFVVNATPALVQASPVGSGANTPITHGAQGTATNSMPPRKRSINKSEISEPRFIHGTSTVTTVNLPPGASLRNGIEHNAPPIPPVNPRRRQTRAMFGFGGRKDEIESMHSLPQATQSSEEMSTFSADEGDEKPRSRQKLRKSSSEGGNLSARARQATLTSPSPAMPGAFPADGSPPHPIEGGMF